MCKYFLSKDYLWFRCKQFFIMIQQNKKKIKDSNISSNSFKWKHYEGEIILLNVKWYLKYPLSYRNLKEMMAERGIKVDRRLWVQITIKCRE